MTFRILKFAENDLQTEKWTFKKIGHEVRVGWCALMAPPAVVYMFGFGFDHCFARAVLYLNMWS